MHRLHHRIVLVLVPLLGLGLLFTVAGTASAHVNHAKVLSAIPAIGSTINQAPTTVTVDCAENINPDPTKSNLFVYGPAGDLISQGNAKVSLSNPKEMSVTIKPGSNGVYVVRWITVSAVDGDPDEGAFVFTVSPGVSATPTTATTTTNTTTPPTTFGTSGVPLWVPIVVGVLALLIGLASGLGIGRRTAVSSLSALRKSVAAQQQETPTKQP